MLDITALAPSKFHQRETNDRRSIANIMEVIILNHCGRVGIVLAPVPSEKVKRQ